MDNLEKLAKKSVERVKVLTEQEAEIYDVLIDSLDYLPENFFKNNTLAQINEYFGRHYNIMVTENICLALDAQQKLEFMMEDMADLTNGIAPEEYYEDDETEDIDTRISKALGKKHYRKAQRLLKPVIYELEGQLDKDKEYYTFCEPMEQVLYQYYFSPHPDETFIPYSPAYYYYMLGTVYLELQEIDQAKAMLTRAIQFDPVSTEFLLGFAEVYKEEGDFNKTFELTRKALTYAYSREGYARCIRNIGYYLIEDEEYDDASACFQYSLRWEQTEYAENALRNIEEFTGRATKEPDSSELAEIAEKYGFTQGLNPDIRELAEDKRSECEEEGDMEQEAYFSSILEAMSIE